jgi:hypothetical protein
MDNNEWKIKSEESDKVDDECEILKNSKDQS